ncbi:MAG: hypothetical protein COA97_12995 [Flavobacteriales bacterium]|nr:MAG: hypothetical protein COA97_12995 [Flavobacteriales bacterium]
MKLKITKYVTILFSCFLIIGCSLKSYSQNKESVFDGHTIPTDENIMFYIQKNTNPNTVVYALNIRSDGKINPKHPIEVFWRRYEEDGRRKKLGWLERTFAFDFKVKPVKSKPNTYVFSLVAMKKKKVYVTQNKSGSPEVFMKISGKIARLERIYVMVDDSRRIQRVLTMELFGRNFKTGELIYEKMVKN